MRYLMLRISSVLALVVTPAFAGTIVGRANLVSDFPRQEYNMLVKNHGDLSLQMLLAMSERKEDVRGVAMSGHSGHKPKGAGMAMEHCHLCTKTASAYVVSPDGGVANAIISVLQIKDAKTAVRKFVSEQRVGKFVPHVMAVPVGTRVEFFNRDPVGHNLHSRSRAARFNKMLAERDSKITVTFKRQGLVRINCDLHDHMQMFILVTPNPYNAVSAPDGTFRISGVPAGRHKVQMWHEKFGTLTADVEVPRDGEVEVNFEVKLTPEQAAEIKKYAAVAPMI
ncbi:MAG: carboxypeptidase regulatory-like domain-containing protein [Candidatus Binatia bacterium]